MLCLFLLHHHNRMPGCLSGIFEIGWHSIVQCSNDAVQVMTQVMRYKGTQANHLYEKSMHHYMYVQSVSPNNLRSSSLSHTYAHLSYCGIWPVTPGLSTGTLGSFTCMEMALPIYMGPTALDPYFGTTYGQRPKAAGQYFFVYNNFIVALYDLFKFGIFLNPRLYMCILGLMQFSNQFGVTTVRSKPPCQEAR